MAKSVLVVVTNYDFSSNADDLKRRLGAAFDTVLIDNSSPTPPCSADLILPNRHYTGLWNASVSLAIEQGRGWLLFIAADVQVPDVEKLARGVRSVLNKGAIGVYSPALRRDSRASFPACFGRDTGRVRECYVVEGFCFLARTSILQRIYPVDPEQNLYGWGIDVMTAYQAYQTGYKVVVDDRVTIYHPASTHAISSTAPQEQMIRFVGTAGALFLEWTYERLRREGDLAEVPRRWAAALSRLLTRIRNRLGSR